MKYFNKFALALLVSISLFSACKKDPVAIDGALAHIPAHAASVTSFDLQRLLQKADFEEVKQMAFYKNMVDKARNDNPAMAAALQDPATSGIALDGKIYMASMPIGSDPKEMATHVFVPLANAADFEKLLRSTDISITENKGLKTATSNSNGRATWNNNLLVFSFAKTDGAKMDELVSNIFNQKAAASFGLSETFQKAMKPGHDAYHFLSTNAWADNPAALTALTFIDLKKEVLQDNFIASYGDFEPGKFVGHSDFHLNPAFGKDLLWRFFRKETKTDFSKVLPNENLGFAIAAALDPRGIDQFLSERPQSKDYVDFVMNDAGGLDRKQLLDVLNGDLLVASLELGANMKDKALLAFGLKDKKAAKTMLDKALADKKLKEIEPGFYKVIGIGGTEIRIQVNKGMGYLVLQDDVLVYSPDKDVAEKIQRGETGNNLPQNFKDQTFAGWVNLNQVGDKAFSTDMDFLKEMRFNANWAGADFIWETTDPNTNSLKAIFQMMDEKFKQTKQAGEEML